MPRHALREAQLKFLKGMTPERLAGEIQGSRFACSRCGGCDTPLRVTVGTRDDAAAKKFWGSHLLVPESMGTKEHVYRTNRIIMDGKEVRRISDLTGLKWFDVAIPSPTEKYDVDGTAKCLMWVTRYLIEPSRLGECVFYDYAEKACTIYADRPIGCSGFPFALVFTGSDVQITCDCPNGERDDMSDEKALEYASSVLDWYTNYYTLLDKYEEDDAEQEPGISIDENETGRERFEKRLDQGYAKYTVLDSDGLHKVREQVEVGRPRTFNFY